MEWLWNIPIHFNFFLQNLEISFTFVTQMYACTYIFMTEQVFYLVFSFGGPIYFLFDGIL